MFEEILRNGIENLMSQWILFTMITIICLGTFQIILISILTIFYFKLKWRKIIPNGSEFIITKEMVCK